DIDTGRQRLHRRQRKDHLELGIASPHRCGLHRAGQHDRLARNSRQRPAGDDHRVGAKRDENMRRIARGDRSADRLAVGVGPK
ncbi:hypothetical protein ACWKWJ_17200, partial [Sphingopyxis terrae subsp. ummariensis]